MTRLNIPLSLFAATLLAAGCGSPTNAPDASKGSSGALKTIGTLTGPGGSVSLGDAADKFDAAFPRPKDAIEPQNPSIPDLEFRGWQTKTEMASAAIKGGKIVALLYATMADQPKWFDSLRDSYGKPEHDVSNDLGSFASWKQGENEHLVMLVKGAAPMTMQATGSSDTLKALQLDSAQLADSLQSQGASSQSQGEQGHSPDDGHGH